MQIFIKTPNGKILTLEVEQTATVQEIKTKIKKHESKIDLNKQNLIFIGRRLDDNRDLAYYKIRQNSVLYLFSKFETTIKVNVNIVDKKLLRIAIEESDFISTLKEKINGIERIPVKQQKLFFGGKELDKNKRLSEYNIKQDSTIILFVQVTKSSTCSIL